LYGSADKGVSVTPEHPAEDRRGITAVSLRIDHTDATQFRAENQFDLGGRKIRCPAIANLEFMHRYSSSSVDSQGLRPVLQGMLVNVEPILLQEAHQAIHFVRIRTLHQV
jgi:hypothetical protein